LKELEKIRAIEIRRNYQGLFWERLKISGGTMRVLRVFLDITCVFFDALGQAIKIAVLPLMILPFVFLFFDHR